MARQVAFDRQKRVFDFAVSLTGLVLSLPLQMLVAIVVRIGLGSPVFFAQPRPGRDEKIFRLVKFRTMLTVEQAGGSQADADRLTRLGRLLRSLSLDELPTLWNVLRGDMSLVGPRPLLVEYLDRYSPRERQRHAVRPGVTGLAQVSGRNAVDWPERLQLDVEYVERRCWALDLRILLRTVGGVLGRGGISADGHATMPEFTGSSRPGGDDAR